MRNRQNWSLEEDVFLQENYASSSRKEISQKLKRTVASCVNRAKKLGLLRKGKRKYHFNDEFFKFPDIINSYWAGFIAADGCIRNIGNRKYLIISLKSIDRDHLNLFAEHINYNGDVKDRKSKYKKKTYNYSVIEICCCDGICGDLENNYNIIKRKSLVLSPPNLSDIKHKLAFIAGYLDGDGCIRSQKKRLEVSCVGTLKTLKWIQDVFDGVVSPNGKHHAKARKRKKRKYSDYKVTGYRAVFITKCILNLDLPRLSRKWLIAKEHQSDLVGNKPRYVKSWMNKFKCEIEISTQQPVRRGNLM